MKVVVTALIVVSLFAATAGAEIEKNAVMCDTGICLYWWPKLPELKGWHQDKDQSYNYGVNALAPDGASFAKAEAVMYAVANYKPRMPEVKSIDTLIANDKKEFLASNSGLTISECKELATGDGRKLRSLTFFPKSKGNWEQVSYGEEDDFYLVFTLSARSKEGFDKAQGAYGELIARYKEKPQDKDSFRQSRGTPSLT